MIYFFLIFLIFFSFSQGESIGLKKISIRNLPVEYKSIVKNFFVDNFKDIERSRKDKNYKIFFDLYIASVAGNYDLCIDVYKENKISRISCFSASNAEELADLLMEKIPEKLIFLKPKKKLKKKYTFLGLNTSEKINANKLKIISPNGDTLVDYKKIILNKAKNCIFLDSIDINIDTAMLDSKDAAKLLKLILYGYRIKGILIKNFQ